MFGSQHPVLDLGETRHGAKYSGSKPTSPPPPAEGLQRVGGLVQPVDCPRTITATGLDSWCLSTPLQHERTVSRARDSLLYHSGRAGGMFLSGRVGGGGLGVDAMRGRTACRVRVVIWSDDRNVRVSERARGVRV